MRIRIKGKEILLNDKEVKVAKRNALKYIEAIKRETENAGEPTYYFTSLIVMHLLSQQLLDEIDVKDLERYVNQINQLR